MLVLLWYVDAFASSFPISASNSSPIIHTYFGIYLTNPERVP